MTEGELKLYHNTFEAGRRQGMEDMAEKIMEEIKDKDAVMILKDAVIEIIDKYMKEIWLS